MVGMGTKALVLGLACPTSECRTAGFRTRSRASFGPGQGSSLRTSLPKVPQPLPRASQSGRLLPAGGAREPGLGPSFE